ncbi:hypothetical protein [Rhodococcus sp. MS16]|nr:hypothetical protein [Rhodococcus sp. MS16]
MVTDSLGLWVTAVSVHDRGSGRLALFRVTVMPSMVLASMVLA